MVRNRLVIGLDIGTTFTGVSFCETTDASSLQKDIKVIQDWSSAYSQISTREKVPTEIAYLPDGKIYWGADIPPHVKRHKWTKLELDGRKAGILEKIRQELAPRNVFQEEKDPVRVIGDFLAGVKIQLIINLDTTYGPKLWRYLPMTLVATVPAVWSDSAKSKTMDAITQGGFTTEEFPMLERTITTTEPEAAALYTIQSMERGVQDAHLAFGDAIVVCDLGGGTVDLISYRVSEVNPTVIEEATVGTGDQCGGSFVERGFLHWLQDKLGVEDFVKIAGCQVEELLHTSLPPRMNRMLQDFMIPKSGFSGVEEYWLRLPGVLAGVDDEDRDIFDGEIRLTPADMKQMFEFPLRRTLEMIQEQFDQTTKNGTVKLKYVFMVGGFAESKYMYQEIRAMTNEFCVETIKPIHAWSAIVRGATVKGLEGDGRSAVKVRKCRRHYGTAVAVLFVPGKHRKAESYIDEFTGEKRATNQMDWMVYKGQNLKVSENSHCKISIASKFWVGEPRRTTLSLMATDIDKAPHRSRDQNVYQVAELVADLSLVPHYHFKRRYSLSGRAYDWMEFNIEIAIQSALEYWVSVDGQKYGSVTANYA